MYKGACVGFERLKLNHQGLDAEPVELLDPLGDGVLAADQAGVSAADVRELALLTCRNCGPGSRTDGERAAGPSPKQVDGPTVELARPG